MFLTNPLSKNFFNRMIILDCSTQAAVTFYILRSSKSMSVDQSVVDRTIFIKNQYVDKG